MKEGWRIDYSDKQTRSIIELEKLYADFAIAEFIAKPEKDRLNLLNTLMLFWVDTAKEYKKLSNDFSAGNENENEKKEKVISTGLLLQKIIEKIKNALTSETSKWDFGEEKEILLGNRLAEDLKKELEDFSEILNEKKAKLN